MTLREYITNRHVNISRFARALHISTHSIYNYLKGTKPEVEIALRIVKETKGEVTLKDLGIHLDFSALK